MNATSYLLSVGPLTQETIQKLETQWEKKLVPLHAKDLRRMPVLKLYRFLRNLSVDTLLVTAEDASSAITLPTLSALGLLISAKEKYLSYPLGTSYQLTRWRSLKDMFHFIFACIKCHFSKWQCKRELKILLNKKKKEKKTITTINYILYLNANLSSGVKAGGSIGHIAGVINSFFSFGKQIFYASLSPNSVVREEIKNISLPEIKIFGYPTEINYYRFHKMAFAFLEKWVGSHSVDCIYQRFSVHNYTGVKLANRYDLPLILEYNGSELWCAEKWGHGLSYPDLALQSENLCLQEADAIVTISNVLRDELLERGVPAEKIITYPNCIDPDVFNPERFNENDLVTARQAYNISIDAKIITFVGTFGKWHGVEVLAEVIKEMINNNLQCLKENKLHFLLVGDGQQMPAVKNILKDVDKSFFTFTGIVAQDQAPLLLAASDILISPHVPNDDGSKFFGSPTKLFEYMAMGKPIIASDLEQIGEVLTPSLRSNSNEGAEIKNEVAYLCRPNDVEEVVSAIQFLVENPETGERLGKNARELVLEKYTWDEHVKLILERIQQ